jgi:hypothetical protein
MGHDPVNPGHYKGDTVMRIIEQFGLGFCLGNVVKYVLREKEKAGTEDLKKAAWYLNREIQQRDPETKTVEGLQAEVDDLKRRLLHRDRENTEYSQAISALFVLQCFEVAGDALTPEQAEAKARLQAIYERDRRE